MREQHVPTAEPMHHFKRDPNCDLQRPGPPRLPPGDNDGYVGLSRRTSATFRENSADAPIFWVLFQSIGTSRINLPAGISTSTNSRLHIH
jgi:hypothetical protein